MDTQSLFSWDRDPQHRCLGWLGHPSLGQAHVVCLRYNTVGTFSFLERLMVVVKRDISDSGSVHS